MKSKNKVCYICGGPGSKNDPLNKDHVPPKCLFKTTGENTSINLITLPAHTSCNSEKKADDEYLRLIVITKASELHPDARDLWDDKIMGQIRRPEGRGFHRMILQSMQEYQVKTQAGIILKNQKALNIDGPRLSRILFKICQGLYYKESNRVLQSTVPYVVYPLIDGLQNSKNLEEIKGKFKTVGNGIFRYWWSHDKSNLQDGHFWLTFYDAIDMMVTLGNKIVPASPFVKNGDLRAI